MKHFIFLTLFGAITIMSNAGDGNTTVIPMSQPKLFLRIISCLIPIVSDKHSYLCTQLENVNSQH